MSIVFSKAGMDSLTLERGRTMPYSPKEIEIHQERYLTESNNAKITDYGSDLTLIKLGFNYLSKDNYDGATNGLYTWFSSSTINWSENSFTLTDEVGVAHTVRLWQSNFNMPKMRGGRYQTQLIFKEE